MRTPTDAPPRARIAGALALCCCALACGCGSSSSGSGTTSGGSPATTAGSGASTQTTGAKTGTSSPGAKLQLDTTPRYAVPSASQPIQSGLVQIAYRNIAIAPDTVRARVGSTVRWTNYDSVPHNVTSEGGPQSFASKNFGEGGTFEVKLEKPGTIHYESTTQPATMNGTIEALR